MQNNVYQSAQFNNKQKFNRTTKPTKSLSKGRLKSKEAKNTANVEVLDSIPVSARSKRETVVDMVKKDSKNIPIERSGSKRNRRPNNSAMFTQPVPITRNGSRSKIESKKSSRLQKKVSPKAQNEGPVSGLNGRRASMKDNYTVPKFINYDVNAHKNIWDQYGSRFQMKKATTYVHGSRKLS